MDHKNKFSFLMIEIKDIEFFVYKAVMINFEKIKQSHT